jgi:hypothetical protein
MKPTLPACLFVVLAARSGLRAADASAPSPPTSLDVQKAMDRAVHFLLSVQNRDGSWGSARRTKDLNIYAPVPGAHQAFRAGTTGLCLAALLEVDPPGEQAQEAIARGEEWLLRELPKLRRATGDAMYNVWGHAYGIQALVRMLRRHPGDEAMKRRIGETIRGQFDLLGRYETLTGGWAYYDFVAQTQRPSGSTISFVSATVLVALCEARDAGLEPPRKLVERAIDSIHRQEKPDFSYLYGEYLRWRPQRPINRPGGSLGRSQACNLALRLWGDRRVTDSVLETWLRKLHDRNLWLDIGRKRPIPHESWFQVAGYFFYYGHYYAARCIDELKPSSRPFFQGQLAAILLALQEKDGSFWDYPLYDYHQQYGTAFALMSLERCLPAREF